MSDSQRENLSYMAMGIAIGIGLGYIVSMYMVYI